MKPNLKVGKTALLIALRGPGAKKARRACFPAGPASVHLKDLDLKVQVAAQYVHLGGMVGPKRKLRGTSEACYRKILLRLGKQAPIWQPDHTLGSASLPVSDVDRLHPL